MQSQFGRAMGEICYLIGPGIIAPERPSMKYDLGFFDHQAGTVTSAENPFGAKNVGLGAGADDYEQFRLTIFDRSRSPGEHFEAVEDRAVRREREALPAYQSLLSDGLIDPCGMASLAGIPVRYRSSA